VAKNGDEPISERIAAAIAEGEFRPGNPLGESVLAERFGVSRSPIRDALRSLEGDGLVVHYPRRGHFVAALGPDDIEEIFYVREALEIAAVRLAYTRIPVEELQDVERALNALSPEQSPREAFIEADRMLHDLIARNSGNRRLWFMLRQLNAQIQITRRTSTSRHDRLPSNLAEHKEIINALKIGDLPLIEARLRVHLKAGKESTMEACRANLFVQVSGRPNDSGRGKRATGGGPPFGQA
jgi:DNA-binding GntR family transcriptional regulator